MKAQAVIGSTASRAAMLAGLVVLLAGCRDIEGEYLPGCTAFAGSRIELADGRYSWDRFTDARRIDADGNVVDPYPNFPKTGAYERDGPAVRLLDADGGQAGIWFLHRTDDGLLLLDEAQQKAWEQEGGFPDCPLMLQNAE